MAERTQIEWVQDGEGRRGVTWNPTTGCSRISAGCEHCYALTLAARLKRMGSAKYQTDGRAPTSGPGFGVALHEQTLDVPRRWRSPRTVFVNSMSDLFHAQVPDAFIARVFEVMVETPQHTYQLLTKRSTRLRRLAPTLPWPANVWMGVTVEDGKSAGRADDLRRIPSAVRFLSCEPLLGSLQGLDLRDIDWVIAGGESGADARPVDVAWLRQLRDAANEAGTAYFFKQWGGRTPKSGGRLLDGRTWSEMPVHRVT